MFRILLISLQCGLLYGQNCKVIFNDESLVSGNIQVLDRKFLYFIPSGSVKPEKISVENIRELRMIDGVLPVLFGSVKYIYVDGSLIKNDIN